MILTQENLTRGYENFLEMAENKDMSLNALVTLYGNVAVLHQATSDAELRELWYKVQSLMEDIKDRILNYK